MLHPVVLSGGSGTRLWPLSRTLLPKQFLSLTGDQTLFQETLLRLKGLPDLAPPIIVSGAEQRFLAGEQLREVGFSAGAHLLEPIGRNTAPAIAVAALSALERDPDAVLLVLPADHVITEIGRFHAAIGAALQAAVSGKLVTFGMVATSPETGYGYIERGARLGSATNVFAVARFVEKPDAARAAEFLRSGGFYWNSGMFVFRAARYLEALGKHRPEILESARAAWQTAARDLDFIRLGEEAFRRCPSDSIDYAVMEKTADAAVVEADIGWSDVGSWASLWQVQAPDSAGNVVQGDVHVDGVKGSYLRAESRLLAAIGVEDLVVVETADAVLVAHKNAAQRVKDVVEALKSGNRTEHISHTRVYRPWGYYESLDEGERFQVKRIMVKAGSRLSLQYHHRRAEHWIVVSGHAKVTRGDDVFDLRANESTFIPLGMRHRLENPGPDPLYLIEVQSGDYLGEDDIVRLDDDFKRS